MTSKNNSSYVALVDSGIANLGSVYKGLKKVNINVVITSDYDQIMGAKGIVFPGVGAFEYAMYQLKENNIVDTILKAVNGGTPFLGICLGLQLLFSTSEERSINSKKNPKGLDIIAGNVKRFPQGLPVPHVGWNSLLLKRKHPLFNGFGNCPYFYFTHSYFVSPDQKSTVLTETTYGNIEFASSLAWKNIMGVQFHPEKSGPEGLRLLNNFGNIVNDLSLLKPN